MSGAPVNPASARTRTGRTAARRGLQRPLGDMVVAVVLAALVLVGLGTPAHADDGDAPEAENLLVNPGFEHGTAPHELDGWSPWGASSAEYFTTATDPVSEGAQSLWFHETSDTRGAGLMSDLVPVTADAVHRVALDANLTSGRLLVIVYYYDAASETVSSKQQPVEVDPGSWQRAELDFYAPPTATTAAVMLYSGIALQVDVHVDNLHFGVADQDGPGDGGEDPRVQEVLDQNANVQHLGQPVRSRLASMPAVAQEDGRWVTYQVFKGEANTATPATLTVTDIETGEVLRTRRMATASGAAGLVVSSTGTVYIGASGDRSLWVYNPTTHQIRNAGAIGPSNTQIFGMTAGPDGTVYVGTYPEARVHQYDPATDQITDLGRASATELYAQGMAYDPDTDSLFVGVGGQKASIWRWSDAGHGELTRLTTEATSPGLEAETRLMNMSVINGRIYVRTKNVALFVVQTDGTVDYWNQGERAVYGYRFFAHPTDPNLVLYGFGDKIYYYDVAARSTRVAFDGVAGYLGDMAWVDVPGDDPQWPGLSIYGAEVAGVVRLNLETGAIERHEDNFSQPTVIQSIFTGPDNTMWASGFQSGLARIGTDPEDLYPTINQGQFESGLTLGSKLYLGGYGNAEFKVLDTTNPDAVPQGLFNGHDEGQDRPFAMAWNPELNQIYLGTVATYGATQGGFAVYDVASGAHQWYTTEIVEDQSVISVMYNPHDGLVYIGTTLDGGLASDPSGQTEARLIVWDPVTQQTVRDIVPVAGKEGISGLVVGPDQKVWGIAENVLFTLDPATGQVDFTQQLAVAAYPKNATTWRWADLQVSPIDNNVYATVRNKLFMIDGETKEFTALLASVGKYAAMDDHGDIYFEGLGSHIFRYVVPQPITNLSRDQKCLAVRAAQEGRSIDLSGLADSGPRGDADRLIFERIVAGVRDGAGKDLAGAYCS